MKRKLNVLCIVMLLMMATDIIAGFVVNLPSMVAGWRAGYQGEDLASSGAISDQWWFVLPVGLVMFGSGLCAFVTFIRFILNVNHNEVFTWDNVHLLRLTGLGVLAMTLANILYETVAHQAVAEVLENHIDLLIFGTFCLIVTEVFGIGLKLKEEQELTI